MGIVQSKQVAVDFVQKLEKIGKLIFKIIEAGKEVAQSAENTQKAKEIRAYFDAPPISADALCATYVQPRSGKPTFAFRRLLVVRNFKFIEFI